MRSERRHELHRNALAKWLIQSWETVKPYLNLILIGVIVAMLAFLGYTWVSGSSASKEANAWDAVFLAMGAGNASELERTVEQYPKTTAAEWAAVVAGDLYLQAGCEELFTTKATAADELQRALDKYKSVLAKSRAPVVRERATYGLARTYEAMAGARQSQGDLDLAAEHYEKVAQEWPDGAYAAEAARRAAALKQLGTRKFYDAFAAWEPKPAFTSPEGMDKIDLPFDDASLTEGDQPKDFFGDIKEGLDKKIEGAKQAGAPESTASGSPAADAAAQGAEAPAEPVAEAKPAEAPAKPAAEPAGEAPQDTPDEK
ncbi:MAG: hypothetical protein GXY25_12230 [Pirellulaceae bacterium]|jgi:tetratricopeptide (TPR) repeat protein|nr:hypothetical protein [Thermoguttaceae bacterium]MDI9445097.1 hypothetical protein [Planctomycetota bacterium]NLZ01293.1 hypothetical protein [Pirellulaceae bacterium]